MTEGHPDKVCDQISDAVLDAVLSHDPDSRAAIECCATTGMVLVMGELSTDCYVEISKIVRDTVKGIGYTQGHGFSYNSLAVITAIHGQSADIAMGVDASVESRAGRRRFRPHRRGRSGHDVRLRRQRDGELMPLTAVLAQKLAKRLAEVRKNGLLPYLRPDGKTQVTVEYEGKKPVRVDTVVVSAQHDEFVSQERLHEDIRRYVIDAVIDPALLDENTKFFINPTGRFEIGGPEGDSGLTGRKIIVDTYGGRCAHGGGSFSGKDATKVDRSATYMARYVCKISLRRGSPTSASCRSPTRSASRIPCRCSSIRSGPAAFRMTSSCASCVKISTCARRPSSKMLGLRRPIFRETAAYGHFGRAQFPWEQTDMAETLKKYL